MIIYILDSALAVPFERLVMLGILQLGRRRYKVRTRPTYRPGTPAYMHSWLSTLDPDTEAEARLALERGAREQDYQVPAGRREPVVVIEKRDSPHWPDSFDSGPVRLPPDATALRFLQQPLEVLLENDINDWRFLCRTGPPAPWRARFQEAVAHGWLQPRMGGGITSLKKTVDWLPKTKERQMRTWALFDSDAREPGAPSAQAQDTWDACEENAVPFWMLRRRAIENYVPRAVLQGWASQVRQSERARAQIDAFTDMTNNQRHHYNMAHGLAGDRRSDEGLAALYHGLTGEQQQLLDDGFAVHQTKDRKFKNIWSDQDYPLDNRWLHNDGWSTEREQLFDSLLASM